MDYEIINIEELRAHMCLSQEESLLCGTRGSYDG